MKTILTIMTLILFSLSCCKTYSQNTTNHLELLKGRTWIANEALKATIRYTDTEAFYYIEDELVGSMRYHLSDKNAIDASYDPGKVGLIQTGRWIFYEDGKSEYYEFLSSTRIKFVNANTTTIIDAKP